MGSNPTQAQCNFSSEELHWVSHGVVGGKCQYFTLSSFKYIYLYSVTIDVLFFLFLSVWQNLISFDVLFSSVELHPELNSFEEDSLAYCALDLGLPAHLPTLQFAKQRATKFLLNLTFS